MNDRAKHSEADVASLYAAGYPTLVGQLTLAAGSRAEAEECAQEAYVRLLERWEKIRDYDDPTAWVRLVAFRLLSNRRRRRSNETRALRRLWGAPVPETVDPAEFGDAARWLTPLSLAHRQVVVLHHLLGMDVLEVARVLDVPVGTVKSRLARARRAMHPLARPEVSHD